MNTIPALPDANPYFDYKNYSVPKDDPIHDANNQYELKEAIRRQMQPASCVLILAGVYASCSKWINIEIELAKSMNKKIIAVEPWGSAKTSLTVNVNTLKHSLCSFFTISAAVPYSPFSGRLQIRNRSPSHISAASGRNREETAKRMLQRIDIDRPE